ncbi:AAA family ATPase, partial [Tsukamurella tyrosinosolvens]|uniref:AAA family ATPase n=1 Tax=Tsukamurella tyrosinosolvens TaxID=57704 RepID=UPI002480F75B
MILCVTGTSTGVGKTVATAALAAALLPSGPVTVVKPAQTGFADGAVRDEDGQLADAAEVARLAPGAVTPRPRRP